MNTIVGQLNFHLREMGIAIAVGSGLLVVWLLLDRTVDVEPWRGITAIALNVPALVAGILVGVGYGDKTVVGILSGSIVGSVLAALACAGLALYGAVVQPTGNEIDMTIDGPLGYVSFAAIIAVFAVPYFGIVGAVGAGIGLFAIRQLH